MSEENQTKATSKGKPVKRIVFGTLIGLYIISFSIIHFSDKTIGFDYDATISFSSPTFQEATKDGRWNWKLINGDLLKLEKKKGVSRYILLSKVLGFTPIVITARKAVNVKKYKRWVSNNYGIDIDDIYMTRDKSDVMIERKTVIFFGDSDGDIENAIEAGAIPIRVRRSEVELKHHSRDYTPGDFGEYILPFSESHPK